MNELQQVLLIFAVVVIAGLYFLSRSRQSKSSDDKKSNHEQTSSVAKTPKNETDIEHTLNPNVLEGNNAPINPQKKKASAALKELGTPHIPLSASTEERLTQTEHDVSKAEAAVTNTANNSTDKSVNVNAQETVNVSSEEVINTPSVSNDLSSQTEEPSSSHPNQGQLFFGEEFDIPQKDVIPNASNVLSEEPAVQEDNQSNAAFVETEQAPKVSVDLSSSSEESNKPKHHVLVVDDPGMTGEVEPDMVPPEEIKPSFGIPDDPNEVKGKIYASTNKKPEVFVLLVMSTGQEFPMTEVNQALYGVGLTLSEQSIFVKKDNMGNAFIRVANMLEPGTFPSENLESFNTPGVAMILELPTTVRAPAAMHDLIMMARKVSQRLKGRLYNMERHLIKESDLQSMRDAALDYESEPL